MNEHINRITEAFSTSNAPLSRRICKDLDSKGPMGELASLLFKTEKAVKQAQSYVGRAPVSGRPYRAYSQDRMRKMLMEVIRLLDAHAKPLGITWSWRRDDKSGSPIWVLTIGLPTGQVAYRVSYIQAGPDCESALVDDSRNSERVIEFCARVLDGRRGAEGDKEGTMSKEPRRENPINNSAGHGESMPSLYNQINKEERKWRTNAATSWW